MTTSLRFHSHDLDSHRMDIKDYLARRAAATQLPTLRPTCPQCRKALVTCYCHKLRPFQAPAPFIILQHEYEARNPIATARMAHLSLTNSQLFVGRHFDGHRQIDSLIADPTYDNYMLFLHRDARDLDEVIASERPARFWVLDAKWAQVPKMLRLSPNVRSLPMVKFSPGQPSCFQIRRQPHPNCLSTIESIHFVIERYLQVRGLASSDHHALWDVFHHLIQQQLSFVDSEHDTRHEAAKSLRRERRRLKEVQP